MPLFINITLKMSRGSSNFHLGSASRLGWGETSSIDWQRVELLRQFLVGQRILDVGCGLGIYVDYLSSQGFDCVGVDQVANFIREAKKSKQGTFIRASAESLPFGDGKFETVLLFDILEHGDDVKILQEAKRVTKKRILLIVPRAVDQDLEQSGVIFRHYLDKSHLREYKREDIERLAKKVGMKLIHLEMVHPLYNETIFAALFTGSTFFKKVIRKLVFFILPKKVYPTEYFAVFEKR